MKKILSILLASLLITSMLAGVGAAQSEPTTIRILWWGSQTRHDLTTAMLNKFMEKYPDIKVEMEFTDWGGYWSKLATQVAGGLVPDVVQMDYMYLMQYAQNGVLADLTPYMESGALDVSDVDPSVLDSGKIDGKVYALSTGMNALVMMYRPDVLEEAGVEMPMAPTQSEYLDITKAVFEKTGRTDTHVVSLGIDELRFNLRNVGLNLYNEDGTTLGFEDPAFIVNLWNRILEAQDAGYGLGVGEETQATAFDSYVADTWTGCHWTNELNAYQTGSGCELAMCEVPWLDDAQQPATYFKPSMFWSVSETSAAKDAAITFINFFTNDTDCFDIVGLDRAMPISARVREYLTPNLDATSQKVADMLDYLTAEGHTTPIMKPDVAAHGEIATLLGEYTEQVRYGLAEDLDAFAQEFMAEANALITKSLVAQ
ncbi:MAG TPA: extracellular solute-binding protein [Clostridia bacterium]|nr:extracellular solute-binding protein [Clostridia bacterium]